MLGIECTTLLSMVFDPTIGEIVNDDSLRGMQIVIVIQRTGGPFNPVLLAW